MGTTHLQTSLGSIKAGKEKTQAALLPFLEAELRRRKKHPEQLIQSAKIPIPFYFRKLSDKFIEESADYIDWDLLSETQDFSVHILKKYKDKISWKSVYDLQRIPDEYILHNHQEIKWDLITLSSRYDDAFYEKWSEFIDWPLMAAQKKLSPYLIDNFYASIGFITLCRSQFLSDEFINRHIKEINWDNLSYNLETYSINFIRKHAEKVSWHNASFSFNLSLEILEEFIEKWNWNTMIMYNRNISFDFIIKNRKHIPFSVVNSIVKKEFKKEIR